MLTRVHIFISGLVQGVTFRMFAKRNAGCLGINGLVKNLPDGRVEIILEGEQEQIKVLVKKLQHGPIWARVKDLEIFEEKYTGEFKNFEIKY